MNKKWGYKEIAAASVRAMSEALSEVSMEEERENFKKEIPAQHASEGLSASEITHFSDYSWEATTKRYDDNGGTAIVVGTAVNVFAPKLYGVVNISKSGKKTARYFYRLYSAYKLFYHITGQQGI